MKIKLLLLSAILCSTFGLMAQAPQLMNYQAVVRNAQGQPVTNTRVNLQFQIHQGNLGGSVVFTETDTVTTNQFGLAALQIGSSSNLASVSWGTGNQYLQVGLDVTGGNNFADMGTTQLVSVPYALRALTVDHDSVNLAQVLANGNNAGTKSIVNTGNVAIGTATPAASTALDVHSTNGAVLLPRLTTAQRDNLTAAEGMLIYNTDLHQFQGYTIPDTALDQADSLINNGADGDRAQSFTAGVTAPLVAVSIPLQIVQGPGNSSFTINVDILNGAGTSGTVLSHQQYTITATTSTWTNFYTSGVNLIAGNQYSIHVTEVTGCPMSPCYLWGQDNTGSYVGGNLYYGGVLTTGDDNSFKTFYQSGPWITLH